MRIFVKVKPGAKRNFVEKLDKEHYAVSVREIPEKGKANKEVMRLLSRYFDIPQKSISIKRGVKSSRKVVEVLK